MYCNYCGWELPDDSLFCSRCGKRLSSGEWAREKAPVDDIEWNDVNFDETLSVMSRAIEDFRPEPSLTRFEVSYNGNFVLPIDTVQVHYELENCSNARLHIKNGDVKNMVELNLDSNVYDLDFNQYHEFAPKVELWIEYEGLGDYRQSDVIKVAIADQFDEKYKQKIVKRDVRWLALCFVLLLLLVLIDAGNLIPESIMAMTSLILVIGCIFFVVKYELDIGNYEAKLRASNIIDEPVKFEN